MIYSFIMTLTNLTLKYFTVNGWPTADDLHTEMHAYYRRRWELSMEEGCLLWGSRTVIAEKYHKQLLQELQANYLGMVKMKSLARLHVWWPTLDQDIEEMVRRCSLCQEMQPKAPQAEANPWKYPTSPWRRVHMDFAGPFIGENFLIVVDSYSKWPEVCRMSLVNCREDCGGIETDVCKPWSTCGNCIRQRVSVYRR